MIGGRVSLALVNEPVRCGDAVVSEPTGLRLATERDGAFDGYAADDAPSGKPVPVFWINTPGWVLDQIQRIGAAND